MDFTQESQTNCPEPERVIETLPVCPSALSFAAVTVKALSFTTEATEKVPSVAEPVV